MYKGISDANAYQQAIIDSYDERSAVYDNHVWAREWSIQAVDFCPPKAGEQILDIACGSGTIAFYIADRVGPEGAITSIDISTGMINRCNEKLKETNHSNLEFVVADAENLDFPADSFDRIYCSGGLYWMTHPQAALRHWFELLKPGGQISLTAWPGNSFVWGNGERRALRKQGVEFIVHEFSGTEEKMYQLMELAGFSNIKNNVVERGRWAEADGLKGPIGPGGYTPGQHPDPREGVPEEKLLLAQKDYESEIDRLTTDKGIWHDMTTYFVVGQKL